MSKYISQDLRPGCNVFLRETRSCFWVLQRGLHILIDIMNQFLFLSGFQLHCWEQWYNCDTGNEGLGKILCPKVSNQWLFPIPRKGFTKKHYQVLGNSWLWDEGVQTNNIPHTRGDHLLLCIPGETSIYELRPRGCELEVKVSNAKCQHCQMSTNSNVANFKFQTVNNVKCCQISTMSNACILHINLVHWSCNNFLNFFNAIKDLL